MICEYCEQEMKQVGFDTHHQVPLYTCGCTVPLPSITCPECGMTSYHPNDVKYGYCGNCSRFTDGVRGGASG